MRRLSRAAGVLAVVLGVSWAAAAAASPCSEAISAAMTKRVYAQLVPPPAGARCKLEDVTTRETVLEARWTLDGVSLPVLRIIPRECVAHPPPGQGDFVSEVPPALATRCPEWRPRFQALGAAVATEAAVQNQQGWTVSRLLPALLLALAVMLFVAVLMVSGLLAMRALRSRDAASRKWIALGAAGFLAALIARIAVPFSVGNWYTEVLPQTGPPPWMRFGPGLFAFQLLLREVGLWGPRALVVSQLVVGALAVPLLLAVSRTLRIGVWACVGAMVLLVLSPFHLRLSASASEHVLASTLALGLLLAWLRAIDTGDRRWLILALLLLPLPGLTRVDMLVAAGLVSLWPLWRDPVERSPASTLRKRFWMIATFGTAAALTAAFTYWFVAVPSHHPMPELAGFRIAARGAFAQYWELARTPPFWIPLPAVLLAAVGSVRMLFTRRALLVRLVATVFLSFLALGRLFTHDELVSARYFLFTIPLFCLAAGLGFEGLVTMLPRRWLTPVGVTAALGVAAWTGLSSRQAYATRYAFQDEYSFARAALRKLPPGCTVYEVPIRADDLPRDVDCCLDLSWSPLVLEFPQLHFKDLPAPGQPAIDSACAAYYETAACAIEEPPGRGIFGGKAAGYFHRVCGEARSMGTLRAIAEGSASPRATEDVFHGKAPHIGLYQWTRPAGGARASVHPHSG